ncbi:MAG: PEP/pyruvate-binding domain-containing protein [Nitrososphaerales archaeon]
MPDDGNYIPKVHRIHMMLGAYPILGDVMRERMRQELFRRGVISKQRFEDEVRERAVASQRREGVLNPYQDEPADVWERRLQMIRDNLTEFYWAYNLSPQLFEELAREVLNQRPTAEKALTFNPEMASMEILFQQMENYTRLPPEEQARARHNMQETKVVLIKALISDELDFVRVAKEYLNYEDLVWIRTHRVGRGKIGGKAAGLVLAWKILQVTLDRFCDTCRQIELVMPETYFVGADVSYEFLEINDLVRYLNQKYKSMDQIEGDYPELQASYAAGRFPPDVIERLRTLLKDLGNQPMIVRSSSLLEDNFGLSFAGMYESVFCPNQGTLDENLEALLCAIARVYASIYNPDVLLYRKQQKVLDFDERMAILLQVVQGERYRDFYFPPAAGVAYSRNPFVWNPKLRREDGFTRLVVGLGTRAVERVGEDYPRMVALSHPNLRPESGAKDIRYYSQYYMDVINLASNKLETQPVHEVLRSDFPGLRQLASVDNGDYISPMVSIDRSLDPRSLVITMDSLLTQTTFASDLKTVLKALEFSYSHPVDIEFTVEIGKEYPKPSVRLHLLQCRPHSNPGENETVVIPDKIPDQDIIFGTTKLVPTGSVRQIAYVVYAQPEMYAAANPSQKLELARLIGRINQRLEGKTFILMGPGRWGSSNADLGLKVGYADFYNTRALVEIGWGQGKNRPTLSYGTHFFQDLVESHIYPLAIYPGEPGNPFKTGFFEAALNALPALLPGEAGWSEYVKIIDVPATTGGRHLELVMSGDEGRAVAYLG